MSKVVRALIVGLSIGVAAWVQAAPTEGPNAAGLWVEQHARELSSELARLCPRADAADTVAFNKCRQGLFNGSAFRASLPEFVLWGRQSDAKAALKDIKLTQFAPDVLTNMYMPLFMFDGEYTTRYVASEGLYQIRLHTAFRNQLQPGEFPYPFWHEPSKWSMYENAAEVILWWDPTTDKIKLAQFTVFGGKAPIQPPTPVTHARFDGQWTWSDANGKTQPVVTVFDGLFRTENPYLTQMDSAYKKFALKLRDSQCYECHVPNNPDGMKKLVLFQTPAHAAGEIKRLLKSVREDKMPRDEFGIEQPLNHDVKNALLGDGERFSALVDAARVWEAAAAAASTHVVSAPAPRGQ